ncbi:MAG: prolipoprotein diacylglyceryl transferase [Syntrophus sp. RIFOXYC2_FULL_54_9]|nr:MAG: prolipoprotein diacylglyceryl transferase [Syntrophus sp. GWC2_56_31]OHE32872.1 MAG: prolipoprotein diacylglyceryl transferase [Syntrophus sp. RIFOXYC2_FULL_54_9]HBB15830.1 prolipoprotein diacylglyceryl transferase [Syntrophus sp. (in: bacteria)]
MQNFILAWRHLPSHLSPNLLEIGSFQLRYYSLMYLAAFACTYFLVMYRIRRERYPYTMDQIQDYFVWAILGVILGGRLGYVFFYNLAYYLDHPLEILFPFEFSNGFRFIGISGMSYHGGAIAVLVFSVMFCRRRNIDFWRFADLFCPAIPLGYTFGRIGNFINGELYGRATTVAWGMVFPLDPLHLLRHPSQLYEAFFEGVVLFTVLWMIRRKSPFDGALFAWYMIGYGAIRFFIEFFREPDVQLGFVLGPFSMGQLLCFLMIAAGALMYIIRRSATSKSQGEN